MKPSLVRASEAAAAKASSGAGEEGIHIMIDIIPGSHFVGEKKMS